MSTRCNVLIKDGQSQQWFYRHSDGYPSVTAESLKTFVQWLVDGRIRDNVCQGSGWLIILGNTEYAKTSKEGFATEPGDDSLYSWKVGAYEPTDDEHGDIVYLYTIDMENKTVSVNKKVYSYEKFLNHNFIKEDQ